jgi:type I restriction-modification system DNA methylase subunit
MVEKETVTEEVLRAAEKYTKVEHLYKTNDEWETFNEEQLELFFSNIAIENSEKVINKSNLGQIFTPNILANFMVKLLKSEVKEGAKILDPCIGPNIFFYYWNKINLKADLTGIEIDNKLLTKSVERFYAQDERELINDSFFNYSIQNKFDAIIQNPPYVRQELLNEQKNVKHLSDVSSIFSLIPSQSNLYVYFLLKSIVHLKKGGVLIAVIYDSWLFSQYGQFLKKALLNLGCLEHIYHFRNNAFPDADVGATVIQFKKGKSNKNIKYSSFWNIDELRTYSAIKNISKSIPIKSFLTYKFNGNVSLDFEQSLFIPLNSISKTAIQRGTSSIANGYFIHQQPKFKEQIPFIKDVSKILTFTAKQETAYLLAVNEDISDEIESYLENVKQEILNTKGKFIAVKRNINEGKTWFKVRVKPTGNFIFNYYMRNNVDFIYNEVGYIVSDNFYILNIEKNPMAYLAILNSSFTRLAILAHSRNQGSGLKKIQAYEFKEVPVIDIEKLSKKAIKELDKLGHQLKDLNRYNNKKDTVSNAIDEILIGEYNLNIRPKITLKQLKQDLSFYFK